MITPAVGTSAPSTLVTLAHVILSGLLCLRFVQAAATAGLRSGEDRARAARRAGVTALVLAAWLAGTWLCARSGWLAVEGARPPRIAFVLVPAFVATAVWASTRGGDLVLRALPLAWIVGFQVFRVGVELLLWRLHREGVLPVQMTFEGANWDVLTGLSAPLVAWALARGA